VDGPDKRPAGPVSDFMRKLRAAWLIFFPSQPKAITPKEEGKNRLRMILVADRCLLLVSQCCHASCACDSKAAHSGRAPQLPVLPLCMVKSFRLWKTAQKCGLLFGYKLDAPVTGVRGMTCLGRVLCASPSNPEPCVCPQMRHESLQSVRDEAQHRKGSVRVRGH
jgi:hypothetical protein